MSQAMNKQNLGNEPKAVHVKSLPLNMYCKRYCAFIVEH